VKISETLSQKKKTQIERNRGVAQVIEHSHSMCEALIQSPVLKKKRKRKDEKRKE
jgi:hypothetical protein